MLFVNLLSSVDIVDSVFASPMTTFSVTEQPDYVLIINSYTESTPWSRVFTTPIYKRMITDDDSINAYTEHMDAMLMKTEEDVDVFVEELFGKYEEKPPVMVVLLGIFPTFCCGTNWSGIGERYATSGLC